ncbi:MAG: protein-export chaperone SecB [Gammaproteobacteria bacterium]|nr:protein-export chaperone SecB [Gammaproteobacteria bacterium]
MTNKKAEPEFAIQTVYLKDSSFEAPHTPEVFTAEWQPDVNIDLNIESKKLEDDFYEVVLKVIVTAKLPKQTAFLVEVNQAGIFMIKNFAEEQMKPMLGSFCPNILFPYAREAISDLIGRGGFPPLYLSPVNFDALYQQNQEQKKQ